MCTTLSRGCVSMGLVKRFNSIDPSESSKGGGIDSGRPGSVRYNLGVNEYFREPDRGIGENFNFFLLKARASAGYFLFRGFRTIWNKLKKLGSRWVFFQRSFTEQENHHQRC